jgi:catechol 2,3-dioxygenase-like lactoylglutathione lyase family enzyme
MAYGYLRFVQVTGVAQQQLIRPLDAQPWETGGLWLIYTRARDNAAISKALVGAGWPSPRGVHGFEFGDLSVKEVHHLGPDGMVLSTIEQVSPPMPIPVAKLTHAFNAAILVRDYARAREFFVDKLGFRPWMEISWEATNPGLNLLADMSAFAGMKTVDTVIVHPDGQNLGSVELIGWTGVRHGRDFAARARPPNLGALALRFAVGDLAAHLRRLQDAGVTPAGPVAEMSLAPYGRVRLVPIVSPDGVWLEFFEVLG